MLSIFHEEFKSGRSLEEESLPQADLSDVQRHIQESRNPHGCALSEKTQIREKQVCPKCERKILPRFTMKNHMATDFCQKRAGQIQRRQQRLSKMQGHASVISECHKEPGNGELQEKVKDESRRDSHQGPTPHADSTSLASFFLMSKEIWRIAEDFRVQRGMAVSLRHGQKSRFHNGLLGIAGRE